MGGPISNSSKNLGQKLWLIGPPCSNFLQTFQHFLKLAQGKMSQRRPQFDGKAFQQSPYDYGNFRIEENIERKGLGAANSFPKQDEHAHATRIPSQAN